MGLSINTAYTKVDKHGHFVVPIVSVEHVQVENQVEPVPENASGPVEPLQEDEIIPAVEKHDEPPEVAPAEEEVKQEPTIELPVIRQEPVPAPVPTPTPIPETVTVRSPVKKKKS